MSGRINIRRGRRGRGRQRRARRGRPAQRIDNQLWSLPTKNPRSVESGPFPNCLNVICKTVYFARVVADSPFVLVEFRLNDVFLPYTGSPISASGLAGASGMYDSYKVRSVRFRVSVVSNEEFVMSSGVFLRDAQPSTLIGTYQQALSALDNGPVTCRGTVGSLNGMSRYVRTSRNIPISRLVGMPLMYDSDRDYAALVDASPNQIVWGAFILCSDDITQNLTNGVTLQLTMTQHTCFFSKKINL